MAHHVRAHHHPSETAGTTLNNTSPSKFPNNRPLKCSKKGLISKYESLDLITLKERRVKKTSRKKSCSKPLKVPTYPDWNVVDDDMPLSFMFEGAGENGQAYDGHAKIRCGMEEDKFLEIVSEIFSQVPDRNGENGERECSANAITEDPLDDGLYFLAASSEDVTDAEMESLAQHGGSISPIESTQSQESSLFEGDISAEDYITIMF